MERANTNGTNRNVQSEQKPPLKKKNENVCAQQLILKTKTH